MGAKWNRKNLIVKPLISQ